MRTPTFSCAHWLAPKAGPGPYARVSLLRSLIDPGANQADLLWCKRFGWRAKAPILPTGWQVCVRMRRVRIAGWTPWTTGWTRTRSAWTATAFGGHGEIVIDAGNGYDKHTVLAVSGCNDFSVFSTLENVFERSQAQSSFRALLAMAANARLLEQRLDVICERYAALFGRGRQFREIDLAEVDMFGSTDRNRERAGANYCNGEAVNHRFCNSIIGAKMLSLRPM